MLVRGVWVCVGMCPHSAILASSSSSERSGPRAAPSRRRAADRALRPLVGAMAMTPTEALDMAAALERLGDSEAGQGQGQFMFCMFSPSFRKLET